MVALKKSRGIYSINPNKQSSSIKYFIELLNRLFYLLEKLFFRKVYLCFTKCLIKRLLNKY